MALVPALFIVKEIKGISLSESLLYAIQMITPMATTGFLKKASNFAFLKLHYSKINTSLTCTVAIQCNWKDGRDESTCRVRKNLEQNLADDTQRFQLRKDINSGLVHVRCLEIERKLGLF